MSNSPSANRMSTALASTCVGLVFTSIAAGVSVPAADVEFYPGLLVESPPMPLVAAGNFTPNVVLSDDNTGDLALAGNTSFTQSFAQGSPSQSGPLRAQRAYLAALSRDWDGYGAEPIDLVVVDRIYADLDAALAGLMFRAPDIIPGADGSVQAEWHLRHIELEYNVSADGSRYLAISTAASEHLEFFGNDALMALRKSAPHLADMETQLLA